MRNLYHTHEDRDRNEQHLPAETILKKEGDRDGEMRGEPRGGGGGAGIGWYEICQEEL
jgi:hypothetical protein